jgi:peptide/nickel transport system permease protein
MASLSPTTKAAPAAKGRSLTQDALRRLLRNSTGMLGLVIISFFVLASLLAPLLYPYDPSRDRNLRLRELPPTWTMSQEELQEEDLTRTAHVFGTDSQGRDVLIRVWHGGRISLTVGLLSVIISAAVGIVLGLISGFFGGWIDSVISWLVDVLLAFPGILLAIAIAAALGPSLQNSLLAISVTQIPIYIRIVRSVTLSLRESEYVQAARSLGSKSPRLIFQHILPNGLSPLIVQLTLSIGTAILDIAALGFLGLGAQPPTPEWGAMISDGFSKFRNAPWMSFYPGLAIFFTVVGFNLLGDGIRDAFDPRLKNVS